MYNKDIMGLILYLILIIKKILNQVQNDYLVCLQKLFVLLKGLKNPLHWQKVIFSLFRICHRN